MFGDLLLLTLTWHRELALLEGNSTLNMNLLWPILQLQASMSQSEEYLVILTFDLLVFSMCYFLWTVLPPTLNTEWPYVHELWHILCTNFCETW